MQKIHVHNDFDVHLNFTNMSTDYVSRVEFWTRRDDIFCCCKCDGSLKVENDSNIVCYLNDHNLGTGKLNYNVIFQIPDPNYADGYKKICQHYVSDIFLTSENGDTTVAIVKVVGGEEATDLINRLSEFEKVFDNKQDKLQFDNTPTSGSKNVVFSDGIYNAIKNNKPDLTDYAKKTDLEGIATEQWVTDKGYITSIPDDYVTESELDNKGYLTEHQSLADYAKKTDLQGLATEQWVDDKGYLTEHQSLEGYVTETELNSKGYLTEHQSLDDYIKKSGPFPRDIATKQWVNLQKYVDELHLDAKVANKAYAIEQWVTEQGYLTSIPDDYITETELDSKGYLTEHQSLDDYAKKSDIPSLEGYVTESELNSKGYLTEHQSLADYATKSDLTRRTRGMATQYWVNDNFVKIKDFIETVHTSIETVTPAEDTEYTLNSYQYLRIIPAAAVKLTFNKSDGFGIMREYHILIDCKTAVPTTEFKGVLWELNNDPVFEKGRLYDIVIRNDGTNLYGSWKAYKLMGITILITTSDATDVQLNGTTYNLVAGDNSLTDSGFETITDIDGFNDNNIITSLDFGGSTIKIEDLSSKFSGMSNLREINNITIKDVVNFSSMFASDTQLQKIDTSKWDVSKVTYFTGMFNGCTNLVTLDLSKWNTSSTTSFGSMFGNCLSLTTLDVSNWNVSSAAGFMSMFNGCTNLKTLDVSRWNTSSAKQFGAMFKNCTSLTALNVSDWNTSNVTNFGAMFDGCSGLTSLDVSNWDTSSGNSFRAMFNGCTNLKTLDVSRWNTSGSRIFMNMFNGCSGLKSLGVSTWNVSSATDFSSMFANCSGLTALNVSGWNPSSATDFNSMFYNCQSLTSLDVSNWDVSKVTIFGSMFNTCSGLTSLDVSKWNTSSAINFGQMFYGCKSLTSLDVSNWVTSNVAYFGWMFYNCQSLTSLDVSNWDVSKATDFSSMFNNCYDLTSLDVSGWNTSSATDFSGMFSDCRSLQKLDVSNFNTSNVTTFRSMFYNCIGLTSLDVSNWNVSSATDFSYMFDNCTNLKTLDLSGWNISESANITDMLDDCNALTTIKMIGCSQDTIDKIASVKRVEAKIITE